MELFYSPEIEQALILPEEESKHCVRVLRHNVGDVINVIDGVGGMYEVRITDAHQKRVSVEIISKIDNYSSLPYSLHMAVAPTKNIDRFEWYAEKATEIGVHKITPLLCRYSERKVIKPERIERILLSASKQSYKALVPILSPMTDMKSIVLQSVDVEHKFIAHCYGDISKEHFLKVVPKNEDVLVLVGPEGDFSREEVDYALANGFVSVSLGESRLRTETAGVVACSIVSMKNI